MRKIQIIGLAFAAVFAFSMVSASGASAFTLWDQCTKTASPLEFLDSNCTLQGPPDEWGWEEIKAARNVESLLTILTLVSKGIGGSVKLQCEGFMDGTVGPGAADEVTLILNEGLEEVTLANPTECKVTEGANLCTEPALAGPHGLPWVTALVATGDLLGPKAGGENPGWEVKCANGASNLCERADTILKVVNKESELEVALTFPLPAANELATCTNGLLAEGEVVGTVSIFLENGNALRAM